MLQKRDDMLPRIETSYPGYSNMYRALTINDTVVANFLIDLRNIQRILLVDKDEECRRFISDDSHIPPKCNLILNLGADEFRAGYRIYANLQPLRRGRILRKSAADQLKYYIIKLSKMCICFYIMRILLIMYFFF